MTGMSCCREPLTRRSWTMFPGLEETTRPEKMPMPCWKTVDRSPLAMTDELTASADSRELLSVTTSCDSKSCEEIQTKKERW